MTNHYGAVILAYGNHVCKVALGTSAGRNLGESSLSQEAARLLALELYRKDKLSLGPVAELRQTPVAALMDFSAKHGVRLALFF
jgi:predicted HTH domain antitoxin